MFDFIGEFISNHYWTISYTLTYTLSAIVGVTIITRFIRMFPTYIKTGSMGSDKLGILFINRDYNGIHGKAYLWRKVKDFFTATHLEIIISDLLVCGAIILVLHVAWIVLVVAGLAFGAVYGVVKFMQHLRNQHVKKEEFVDALKGD